MTLGVIATSCGAEFRAAPAVYLPTNAEPSVILASDGTLLTTIQDENRVAVSIEQIPRFVQDAVIAVEDERFWTHNGVDIRAIVRAASSNAGAGTVAEGGSTITQQYVKLAFLTPEQSFERKLEEATLAMAIERSYSKQLILELYLNTIFLGNRAYGIGAASREYFGVDVSDLTIAQGALLAAVIQAPSRHDPRKNPDGAMERRDLVLRLMYQQDYITEIQYNEALATPLELAPSSVRTEQQRYLAPHFVEEVRKWLLYDTDLLGDSPEERRAVLVGGGLRIETTIDLALQAQAEESISNILANQGTDPRMPDAALVSIEPATGFIRAMVGGYDYFGSHSYSQVNLAVGTGRQTGSSYKPIVMAAALDAGVSATQRFPSPQSASFRVGNDTWRVSGGRGIGSGTMAQCTVVSSNTCYANIILDEQVGAERSVEMAYKLGIRSTTVEPHPATVLGSNNATVADMANVYATIANDGLRTPLAYVTKITGADGSVIYQHQLSQERALSPEAAREIIPALEGVIYGTGGTGSRGRIDRPAAGKTGSAQRNTDAWFVGFTRELSTAVWVGFAEPRENSDGSRSLVPMQSPNTRITVGGGTYPTQIWADFMRNALEGIEPQPLINELRVPPPTTTVPPPNADASAPVPNPVWVDVPDVEGITSSRARQLLQQRGLTVRTVTATTTAVAPGYVYGQSPRSGTAVVEGSDVWIEVSAFPTTTTTTASTTTTTTTSTTTTVPSRSDLDNDD